MKKNYIIPELSVVYVNSADCITTSADCITTSIGIGELGYDNLREVTF